VVPKLKAEFMLDPRTNLDWRKVLCMRYGSTTITKDQAPKHTWEQVVTSAGVPMNILYQMVYPRMKEIWDSREDFNLLTADLDMKVKKRFLTPEGLELLLSQEVLSDLAIFSIA
jgi:hypothetical protein